MYLLSVIALMGAVMLMCMIGGLRIEWIWDTPTLLILLLIVLPMLVSTGLFKDFNNAFRFVIRKNTKKSLKELRRSVEAVSLAIKSFFCTGAFVSVTQSVVILGSMDKPESLGPMLCVAFLALLYGTAISLMLLPLRASLQVQIIELLSEEE